MDGFAHVTVRAPSCGLSMVPVPTIMPGCFGDPVKTAEAFEERFCHIDDALRPADPDDVPKGFFCDGQVAKNVKFANGTWVAICAGRSQRADLIDAPYRPGDDCITVSRKTHQNDVPRDPCNAHWQVTGQCGRFNVSY